MRHLLTISLLFTSSVVFAQDTASLKKAVVKLNKALVARDTASLKKLLSDKLSYGHSNAWIQTRRDVINDLYNGKIIYNSIDQQGTEQLIVDGSTASVRSAVDIDVLMEGKPMKFKLHVLQVWIWKNKTWQLFGRQSVKVS